METTALYLSVERDGKQRCDQWHRLGGLQAILENEPLDFEQFGGGRIVAFQFQSDMLQEVDDGIEAAVLMKRRTAQLGQPRFRIIACAFLQGQEQPRFSYACFAADDDHLSRSFLSPVPATHGDSQLFLTSRKRC